MMAWLWLGVCGELLFLVTSFHQLGVVSIAGILGLRKLIDEYTVVRGFDRIGDGG